MSRLWTFVPLVDGDTVYDAAGNEVKIDIDVPEAAETVDLKAYVDGEEYKPNYILPDKVYDVLKWIGLLLLPTLAWMYSSVATVWGLPYIEEVPFTLNVLGTCIAVLIGASSLTNIIRS